MGHPFKANILQSIYEQNAKLHKIVGPGRLVLFFCVIITWTSLNAFGYHVLPEKFVF